MPSRATEKQSEENQSVKIEIDTKDFKQAVSATATLVKKMPSEMSANDARMAILRDRSGFAIVAAYDYFTSSISMPTATVLGNGENGLEEWDEESQVSDDNVVGFAKDAELTKLLPKLSTTKKLILDIDKARQRMTISDGGTKSYRFDLRTPKKVIANYYRSIGGESCFAMGPEQMEWFCSTVSTLGSMVKPSSSKPGYGNVCISATPSKQEALRVSGNSDADGYSMIYDTVISCREDFTALIPKVTAEGLSTYMKQFGTQTGTVDVHITKNDEGKATSFSMLSDSFSLSLSCMTDDFPFMALGRILDMVKAPVFEETFKHDELKKSLDRLAIFAASDNSATVVELHDGGVATLSQKMDALTRAVDAKEDCDAESIKAFPDDETSGSTTVLTTVLRNGMGLFPAKSEILVGIVPGRGSGKLALHGEDGIAKITAVIMGLRA